jgi:hypothetical protein
MSTFLYVNNDRFGLFKIIDVNEYSDLVKLVKHILLTDKLVDNSLIYSIEFLLI